jgi:hypothetical protein
LAILLNQSGRTDIVQGEYSQQRGENSSRALLWAAVACGAIPLAVGSAIYFTFRATRNESLAVAGFYTILAGLVFFAVGIICLVAYAYRQRDFGARTLFAAALLTSNFPLAFIYAVSAAGLMTQYVVQVTNESNAVVDSFVVEGPGARAELGPIQIGESKQGRVFFDADGTLTFTARQQQLRLDGKIEDYVTSSLGGMATIRIKPGGSFEVLHAD